MKDQDASLTCVKAVLLFYFLCEWFQPNFYAHAEDTVIQPIHRNSTTQDFLHSVKNKPIYFRSPSPEIIRIGGKHLDSMDLIPLMQYPPNLKTLNISHAPLINDESLIIQVLANQYNIENLAFSETCVSDKCMRAISKLNKLKRLQLLYSDYITWHGIYHLTQNKLVRENLEELIIHGRGFSSIGQQSDYTEKEFFELTELYKNEMGLAIVGCFKNLQSLAISGCEDIAFEEEGDALLSSISTLQNLEILILPGGHITDNAVKNFIPRLTNLRRLDLSDSVITDECVEPLLQLSNLEEVSIKNTSISIRGVKALCSHPQLRRISISYSAINSNDIDAYVSNERKNKKLPLIVTTGMPLNEEL